jgi:DNA-binding PadR family transcriptional regulator
MLFFEYNLPEQVNVILILPIGTCTLLVISLSSKAPRSASTECLETLPSLAETIVLHIIDGHQPVSGYQVRKKFTEITNKRLSFGTLVPMLHRFEKAGLVVRNRISDDEAAIIYNWYLTPYGSQQLQSRLALLVRMLRNSTWREPEPAKTERSKVETNQVLVPSPEYRW